MVRFALALTLISGFTTATQAATWPLGLGLPWVFGSDTNTNSESDFKKLLESRPEIALSLSGDLDEVSEMPEPPCPKMLAQECLKYWGQLWREGRYHLTPPLADKAISLDPTNLEALHARVVSQIVQAAVASKTACCESSCEPKKTKGSISLAIDFQFRPKFLTWIKDAKPLNSCSCQKDSDCTATNVIVPASHVETIAKLATPVKRVRVASEFWSAECDRMNATGNDFEFTLEGNVSLTLRRFGTTIQANRVVMNLKTGSMQVDGK